MEETSSVDRRLGAKLSLVIAALIGIATFGLVVVLYADVRLALSLALLFVGVSWASLVLATRINWPSRSLERLFLLGFLGLSILGCGFWITRGLSSTLTIVAFATATVDFAGYVMALRSR